MPHGEYQPAEQPEGPDERAEPYPTQGEYPPRGDEVEHRFEQDLRRLMDEQQREDQKKRELLELELLVDQQKQQGELVLNHTAELGKLEKVLLGLYGRDQFLCLYFYVLLPLSFQGFDVRLARHMLPLQGVDLARLASKLRTGNNKLELELEVLDQFLAMFPERFEPYLLFQQ